MTIRRLSELTWAEVAAAAPRAIAVLPVGSQEQHAGHLPMGTDTMLVEAILDEALAAFEQDEHRVLIRLPALPYGHSPHHLFRAAVSLGADTLLRVLAEFLDSLHATGFRRVLLVNGHGGNTEVLALAVKQFALRAPVVAATCNYWAVADPGDDHDTAAGEDPARTPGHAGWFETSLMLAAHPGLVGKPSDQAPAEPPLFDRPVHPGLTIAPNGEWERVGGLTDDPSSADPAVGRLLFRRRAHGLTQAIASFSRVTAPWSREG
jgi:creatinine amidohydrolase